MKKLLLTCALTVLLASGSVMADGWGSSFGALTTAQAVGQGHGNMMGGIGIGDNATSFFGTFTYGLSQYTDGRLKIGLADPDGGGDTEFTLGADFKWQFWNVDTTGRNPFDFAVGGFIEYVDFEGLSIFQFGGQLLASYPFYLKGGGGIIAPYGRFNARVESISFDLPPGAVGDDSESNLELGFNGGVAWHATSTISLYGEFQIDGNDGLFFGVDFNIM